MHYFLYFCCCTERFTNHKYHEYGKYPCHVFIEYCYYYRFFCVGCNSFAIFSRYVSTIMLSWSQPPSNNANPNPPRKWLMNAKLKELLVVAKFFTIVSWHWVVHLAALKKRNAFVSRYTIWYNNLSHILKYRSFYNCIWSYIYAIWNVATYLCIFV